MFKQSFSVIIKCCCTLCLLFLSHGASAGRPIFQNLTLTELVNGSHIVALVKPGAAEASPGPAAMCSPQRLSLIVLEPLTLNPSLAPESTRDALEILVKIGSTISVITNMTSLDDCEFRTKNSNGVSFAASRYRSDAGTRIDLGKPFIIFLKVEGSRLVLTADQAFESPRRLADIVAIARH